VTVVVPLHCIHITFVTIDIFVVRHPLRLVQSITRTTNQAWSRPNGGTAERLDVGPVAPIPNLTTVSASFEI
jgi:hypothetical protein